MENSRIEGIGHQVKGAVKESLGKAIGDAKLAADGTAERTIGDAQNAADTGGDQVFGIDTERVKGIGHQLKGALIQGIGSLVGNPKLQADGVAEQLAGKAQNAAGSERDMEREAGQNRDAAVDTGEKADPFNDGSRP
ncbi:MAG: CsbD family protein [Bradyrhizobium sp.]